MTDNDETADFQAISKSQLKREAHAAQEIGEKLVGLPAKKLEALALPAELSHAIEQARTMHSRSAKKRQLQFIGKLMRRFDWQAIQADLEKLQQPERYAKESFHRCEHWRDRLIEGDDKVLSEFIEAYPDADRQQLRQLLRNARQERQKNRPPKSARQLFHMVSDLLQQQQDQ